jgi:methylase of polypeptide subunit release factors
MLFKKKPVTQATLQEKISALTKKSDALHATYQMSIEALQKIIDDTTIAIQIAEDATQRVHNAIGNVYSHKQKAIKLLNNITKEFPDV